MTQSSGGFQREEMVRIRVRCDGSTIVVNAPTAYIFEGYSVVWDVDARANEVVEIKFKGESPFERQGVYRRVGSGTIVSGASRSGVKGDFQYGVRLLAFDGSREGGALRAPRLVAEVDPMIKI